ncbi:MAG: MFS transporter [Chloroflexi bacterium]|nr:MFS transporter [Chloroflexota bacterium]
MSKAAPQPAAGPTLHPRHRLSLRTFSSLRYPNFRLLWASTFLVAAAHTLERITLGWLVYDVSQSPFLVGMSQGLQTLPLLVIGPLVGAIADRMDRRRLLFFSQAILVVVVLAFAAYVASGARQVWPLLVFALLSGVGWAFNTLPRQALLGASVPRGELLNAYALNNTAFSTMGVLVPAIGGFLIAWAGPALNFFLEGALYIGFAAMILRVGTTPVGLSAGQRAPMMRNILEGMRYVLKEPVTLGLIGVAMVPALFIMPFANGLMPVYAKEVLGKGPEVLGVLLSSIGVGSLLGMMLLASLGDVRRKGYLLFGTAIFAGLMLVAFSISSWFPLSVGLLLLVGAGHMVYIAAVESAIQVITPDGYRGRVLSIFALTFGVSFCGSLLAGGLAQVFGAPLALLTGGLVTSALLVGIALRFSALRRA